MSGEWVSPHGVGGWTGDPNIDFLDQDFLLTQKPPVEPLCPAPSSTGFQRRHDAVQNRPE